MPKSKSVAVMAEGGSNPQERTATDNLAKMNLLHEELAPTSILKSN